MMKDLVRLLKDEEAPTAVEYGLMVAGIAVVILGAVWALGGNMSSKFTTVSDQIAK
jgi:pilus assembly protein Flp/PilA